MKTGSTKSPKWDRERASHNEMGYWFVHSPSLVRVKGGKRNQCGPLSTVKTGPTQSPKWDNGALVSRYDLVLLHLYIPPLSPMHRQGVKMNNSNSLNNREFKTGELELQRWKVELGLVAIITA